MKYSGIELELIRNPDMLQFWEDSCYGGISGPSKRYARANNPYMKDFNPQEEVSYLTFLDINSLYATALSDYLPYEGFTWLTSSEIEMIDWIAIPDDHPWGFLLEVDLSYDKNSHDYFNDMPILPERYKVKHDELSNYQKTLCEQMKIQGYKRTITEKLMLTFYDKKKYIIHYRHLRFCLEKGVILKKVHRVIAFKQKPFFKPFIDMNVELRKNAKNEFEKTFRKLVLNSLFGKCCEQVRKRQRIKLALNRDQARRSLKKPFFDSFQILDENKSLIRMRNTSVYMNKPMYIGAVVLSLSKLIYFKLHYDVFKKKYPGDRLNFMYGDTDSMIYHIKPKSGCIYNDFSLMKEHLDFSDYDKDHFLYDVSNKKVLGKLKDEVAGKIITEVIALKPKVYSLITECEMNKKVAKGTKKATIQRHLRHEHYKEVLFEQTMIYALNRKLESKDHFIRAVETYKMFSNCLEDKRYYLDDGIESLAYGHKDIE